MLSAGTIYFLCPDVAEATGGVTKIYEFALALSSAGYSVAVVHQDPGYRPSWISINVRIVDAKNTVVGLNDLLVVPEFMSKLLSQLSGCAKVVLNQNSFSPGLIGSYDEDVCAIISTSEYISRQAAFCYPEKKNFSIKLGYDHNIFRISESNKKRQIAYMPRRRSGDSRNILQALERRGSLKGWSVTAIDKLSFHQVAGVLRESMIFLSFSQREGFGLPPLEAMASGCLVVGFHGIGGAEFFDQSYCYPIPEDDICLFQETLEGLLLNPNIEAICKSKGWIAACAVSQKYTMQMQDADIVNAFGCIALLATGVKNRRPVPLRSISFEPNRFKLSARFVKKAAIALLS